ncbi:MAG: hypothetical protein LC127_18335 [Chitinophagales bacterium]|nr:hypothetical protein [Chitinophagales bacterium]
MPRSIIKRCRIRQVVLTNVRHQKWSLPIRCPGGQVGYNGAVIVDDSNAVSLVRKSTSGGLLCF